MSIKLTRNEINSFDKKISIIRNQTEKQSYRGKRKKKPLIKNNQFCSKCMKKGLYIMVFNSKLELIDNIKRLLRNNINNYKEKLIKPIQQIEGFKTNIICKKCFEKMIFREDCLNEIKEIFFQGNEKIYSIKLSSNINEKKSQINLKDNQIINKNNNMIYDFDIDEYNECLENIIQCIKISFLQISFFAKSFRMFTNHTNIINNTSQNKIYIEYFFHSYIHAKAILENLYILINKIIIKFKNITNRIISTLKFAIFKENFEGLKTPFDIFVNNTNLILANILNLVNNNKISLSALRCINDDKDLDMENKIFNADNKEN